MVGNGTSSLGVSRLAKAVRLARREGVDMRHALKSKPDAAVVGTRQGVRLSLASSPALTGGGRAKLRAAAQHRAKRDRPR
jgi:hypothetical protein